MSYGGLERLSSYIESFVGPEVVGGSVDLKRGNRC